MKYYSGVEGLEQIVWNTLSSKDKNMYGYSSWDRNNFLSQKYIDVHQKEALLRGPKDHVIVNDERILKEDFSVILNYMKIYPLEMRYLRESSYSESVNLSNLSLNSLFIQIS